MALALQARSKTLPLADERRRFQRVRVNLLGRWACCPTAREYPCQVANMSPGGMAVIAPVSGQEGERVVAYIDPSTGRLEGKISRLHQNGFAMTVSATPRRRAASSPWLPGSPTGTSSVCRKTAATAAPFRAIRSPIWRCPTASTSRPGIIDLSLSGAAVATDQRPAIGMLVMLGKVQGRVVRQLDDGFAVEFTRLQHPDFLEESVCGT